MDNEMFVYLSVLNKSLDSGVPGKIAEKVAQDCLDTYKKNIYNGKPLDLIKAHIAKAVKLSKDLKKLNKKKGKEAMARQSN